MLKKKKAKTQLHYAGLVLQPVLYLRNPVSWLAVGMGTCVCSQEMLFAQSLMDLN